MAACDGPQVGRGDGDVLVVAAPTGIGESRDRLAVVVEWGSDTTDTQWHRRLDVAHDDARLRHVCGQTPHSRSASLVLHSSGHRGFCKRTLLPRLRERRLTGTRPRRRPPCRAVRQRRAKSHSPRPIQAGLWVSLDLRHARIVRSAHATLGHVRESLGVRQGDATPIRHLHQPGFLQLLQFPADRFHPESQVLRHLRARQR